MKNEKVVVMGGAGFVGSHLVSLLLDLGARVLVLDNLSHGRYLDPGSEFVNCDVSKVKTCIKYLDNAYAVFNLAAGVAGVEHNRNNNAVMFQENVNTLVSPVMAAAMVKVPHFVQFSSVCVYDPDNQDAPTEDLGHQGFPHRANQGYGQAKRIGELAALNWVDLDHAIVVRPTNMTGIRDHFRPIDKAHVIPALIQRIDEIPKNKPDIEVYGSGSVVREFMDVRDCARAVVHLACNTTESGVYNVGTGGDTALTISELVITIAKVMGKKARPFWNQDRGGGDNVRRSNVDKIRATGWTHEYDLETSLAETVDWYYKYEKNRGE